MKRASFLMYISIYLMLSLGFAIYWGQNFTDYVHFKGDDFWVTVKTMLLLTYLAYLVFYAVAKEKRLWILFFVPLVLIGSSLVFGFVAVLAAGSVWEAAGTVSGYTLIYSMVYAISASVILNILRKQKSPDRDEKHKFE